ncbi:MAG TPA: TetR/AcrR family transcriptional regulator [Iamia sp.]|nr:TetR/AcrR family transcriptional regulator [Iamia sp.]
MSPARTASKKPATSDDAPPVSAISLRRKRRRDSANARSDTRWTSILDAAATVFHRRGYAATTLDEIADEVGINRASLYYYVGTKADLLAAIVKEPLSRFATALEEVAARDVPPRETVRLLVVTHMELLAESYPQLMIYLGENLHREDPDMAALVRRNGQRHIKLLADAIQQCKDDGEFRDDLDARLAAMGILGMCNDVRHWWSPGRKSLPELGELFASMVIDGLATRPPTRKRR